MTPILLTTVHDPHGKLVEATQNELLSIAELYAGMVVEMTDNTDPRLKHLLSNVAHIHYNPPGDIANARRLLIRNGLLLQPAGHFHFADYDRLLHWWIHYPDELRQVVAVIPDYDFVVLGRTERAMQTHPFVQRQTERLINRLFAHAFGQRIDPLTASRGISNRAAQVINAYSCAVGPAGVDVEWPILAGESAFPQGVAPFDLRLTKVSAYIPVEGLEYESDTFGIGRAPVAETAVRLRNLWQGVRMIVRLYGQADRRRYISGKRPRPTISKSGT